MVRKFPTAPPVRQLQVAVAAYNCGAGGVASLDNADALTTTATIRTTSGSGPASTPLIGDALIDAATAAPSTCSRCERQRRCCRADPPMALDDAGGEGVKRTKLMGSAKPSRPRFLPPTGAAGRGPDAFQCIT